MNSHPSSTPSSSPRFGWFAAACVVLILMGLTHIAAHLAPPPKPDSADQETLQRLLTSLKIDLVGSMRTMHQIFNGFSVFFVIASVAAGVAGLAVRSVRPRPVSVLRRLGVVYALGLAAALADSLVNWFIIPTSFISLALALTILSLWRDAGARATGEPV